MTREQEKALLDLIEHLTHAVVEDCPGVEHAAKVGLLDDLCEVKRQFGIENPVLEST
jgi:hypothetical protein